VFIFIIILQENKKPGCNKLFNSDDEDDAEDDGFQIKPQFEGKAGQKVWVKTLVQDRDFV